MPALVFIVAHDIVRSHPPDLRKKGQRQTLPFESRSSARSPF